MTCDMSETALWWMHCTRVLVKKKTAVADHTCFKWFHVGIGWVTGWNVCSYTETTSSWRVAHRWHLIISICVVEVEHFWSGRYSFEAPYSIFLFSSFTAQIFTWYNQAKEWCYACLVNAPINSTMCGLWLWRFVYESLWTKFPFHRCLGGLYFPKADHLQRLGWKYIPGGLGRWWLQRTHGRASRPGAATGGSVGGCLTSWQGAPHLSSMLEILYSLRILNSRLLSVTTLCIFYSLNL